ncbi:7-cyano-7-deazaguanine synthase [Ferrimonas balearica]|uniref:7-cyano-7-deazaguanine synthase n=1 Tax=Ferrimonas balearica TaxID=44012 RepID=UPI001C96F7E8|nr:7-cyano-7-deazaguanine synthase [Ferrimonas balearica]MBY6105028.1 7-cyano-7-deazaguanine synthase [Ferrimonas balearica]
MLGLGRLARKRNKAVVLLSGGMDSALALAMTCKAVNPQCVHAITFDYGQLNREELTRSEALCAKLGCHWSQVPLEAFGLMAARAGCGTVRGGTNDPHASMLPHKNMVFVSMGLAFAESIGAESVTLGVISTDCFMWDAGKGYFDTLQRLTAIEIRTPLITMSKADIARALEQEGIVIESDTTSCYLHGGCGECPACFVAAQARDGW